MRALPTGRSRGFRGGAILVLAVLFAGALPAPTRTGGTPTPGETQSPRQRYAVVIGISDYASSDIPDLRYAADDARAFYDFLRSPAAGMGGYPEDHIRLLLDGDAVARNVRSALSTFLRHSTPDDVVTVFMAAHGVSDPSRPEDIYLLTHDAQLGDLPGTAVSLAHVQQALDDAYAYMKIVFSDVSHSAGMGGPRQQLEPNRANQRLLEGGEGAGSGMSVVFTASAANQLSQEGEPWGGGHGVFTYYLLQGLNGAADAMDEGGDGDRVVTLGELLEYTRDRVRRETRNAQIPTISMTSYDRFWPMAAVMNTGGERPH